MIRRSSSDAPPSDRPGAARFAAAAVAALQGAALVGNGLAVAVVVLRDGITGPSEVASPVGVAVEIVLYLLFGGALLWLARGLLRGAAWALTPFLLAQLLALAVTIPLAQGSGAAGAVGWSGTALCAVGLMSWGMLLRQRIAVEQRA